MAVPAGRWGHSFEEDHDDVEVYRPEDFDFPRARGRAWIEFGPDGTFVDLAPGPADAPTPRSSGREPADVVRATSDRLELRRTRR